MNQNIKDRGYARTGELIIKGVHCSYIYKLVEVGKICLICNEGYTEGGNI